MKRIISVLTATLLACTMASAQKASSQGVFVGVSASHLPHIKNTYAGVELGYDISEHFAVGASAIFRFPENGKDFGINSFVRYNIVDFHHFVPFVDLKCGYGNLTLVNHTFPDVGKVRHQYSIGLMPGIKYSFTDRLALFARFGAAEYDRKKTTFQNYTLRSHAYQLNFTFDTIRLGIMYKIPIVK